MRHRSLTATIKMLGRFLLLVVVAEVLIRGYAWWGGEQNLFQDDRNYGYRVAPNLARAFRSGGEPYLVETNSRGYRDHENHPRTSIDNFRVVTIGSSTVFGDAIEHSKIFPQRLQELLPRTETVNLSIPCSSADQHYLMLRDEGVRQEPDVVLHFLTHTDLSETFWAWQFILNRPKCWLQYANQDISIRSPSTSIFLRALKSSYICETGVMIVGSILYTQFDVCGEDGIWLFGGQNLSRQDRIFALQKLLLETRDLCQRHGAEYIITPLPFLGDPACQFAEQCRLLREEVLDPLDKKGLVVFHAFDLTRVEGREDHNNTIYQDFHLTARGHELLAKRLAAILAPRAIAFADNEPVHSAPAPDKAETEID